MPSEALSRPTLNSATQGTDRHGPRTERRRSPATAITMTLRPAFRALCPEFDRFLFATIGDEIDGVSLSVVSALVRLGLDPWQEAGRLSALSNREAAEQLARLIAELPGLARPLNEAREIASDLVGLLPVRHPAQKPAAPQVQVRMRFRPALSQASQFRVVCFVLAAAVMISAAVRLGLPFGIGGP